MTHAEFAKHNFALAASIKPYEWRAVLFFYAAVHATNHVLFNGSDVRQEYSHGQRTLDIERHPELKKKSARYRELRKLSESARYHPWVLPLLESQVQRAELLAREILTFCGILNAPLS